MKDKIQLQFEEFEGCQKLFTAHRRLPAPVDDDYPEARLQYERALKDFLVVCAANGRALPSVPNVFSGIIQPWAAALGLRHQGVLVSAVRGCDSTIREDDSKHLIRMYRGVLLVPHVGDLKKSASFMTAFDGEIWDNTVADFLRSIDHYPNHWLLHWLHACEIVGFKHPSIVIQEKFKSLYWKLTNKFHLYPESEIELDQRLDADEKTFREAQT